MSEEQAALAIEHLEAIRLLCGLILGLLIGRLIYDTTLSLFGLGVKRLNQ